MPTLNSWKLDNRGLEVYPEPVNVQESSPLRESPRAVSVINRMD